MTQRMALYMEDKHPIRYELEMARYAEARGFSEIWQADTRLAMLEHFEAFRRVFAMEEVTYHGEFVKLDRVKLDVAYGDMGPRDIPIYIGATGDQMLEMAGEICDGVVLNYVVSVDYIRKAVGLVEKGARKAGKTLADVDRPELLVCCLSDKDPKAAMAEGKKLVAYYLATEPHIMKASGVSDELLEKVQSMMTWPAREEDYIRASRDIP